MEVSVGRRANALRRELSISVAERSAVAPEAVWEVLADLHTHAEWGGARQHESTRILSIDAPEGPASVGVEFETSGADPMGRFRDRSVVTEATKPSTFEFVTEATLETKKRARVDWTLVHRYELTPDEGGCRIAYTVRITRISELAGLLKVFGIPVLSGLAMKASASVGKRGVHNLARLAEERATAR
jgi:uncharacterized protein YndB with AHSA1/START domain